MSLSCGKGKKIMSSLAQAGTVNSTEATDSFDRDRKAELRYTVR